MPNGSEGYSTDKSIQGKTYNFKMKEWNVYESTKYSGKKPMDNIH